MLPYRSWLISTAQTLLNVIPYTFGFFHEKEHLSISLFEQYEELSVSNCVLLFFVFFLLFFLSVIERIFITLLTKILKISLNIFYVALEIFFASNPRHIAEEKDM